jgi:hypothetical protein
MKKEAYPFMDPKDTPLSTMPEVGVFDYGNSRDGKDEKKDTITLVASDRSASK